MRTLLSNSTGWPGMPAGIELLKENRCGLDAIEAGIREVENHPDIHSVGRGSWPNILGELELDASIMDGRNLMTGAVGGLKGYLHPISVARQVMERLPHVLLIGDGAQTFAAECGAEEGELHTETSREAYRRWKEQNVIPEDAGDWPAVPLARYATKSVDPQEAKGTTCFLAIDGQGDLSAGVSTSGWAWKYPGRLGDSPIIGAGCYCDNRYGIAACIGTGEMAIRAGTARSVVLYLKMGMSLREACDEAAADLGYLKGGAAGWVAIHALTPGGEHRVLSVGRKVDQPFYLWREGQAEHEEGSADHFPMGHRV